MSSRAVIFQQIPSLLPPCPLLLFWYFPRVVACGAGWPPSHPGEGTAPQVRHLTHSHGSRCLRRRGTTVHQWAYFPLWFEHSVSSVCSPRLITQATEFCQQQGSKMPFLFVLFCERSSRTMFLHTSPEKSQYVYIHMCIHV